MLSRTQMLAALSILFLIGNSSKAATDTFIESPDGKRLVTLESPELHKSYHEVSMSDTRKTVAWVTPKEVLKDIHDPALFVVDEHDVRHTSAGVKIATFDGEGIRHGDRGKLMINYHHPDISADAASDRMYRVNGPPLTNTELVAVLYALKPEMFKLSDEEVAAQQKAMAEANAEEEARAKADQVAGIWQMLNSSGPVEKLGKGAITVGAKKGDAYPVTFDLTKGGGPTYQGVGFYKEIFGDKMFWIAYGTPKSVAICVYEIKGGTLTGKWYPWYIDGDAKNVGTENLKGPETLDGEYTIESAKAPFSGAAYAGTVTIKPANIVGASTRQAPMLMTWNIGGAKINGIAIRHRDYLIAASGTGADCFIAAYEIQNGSMSSDWYKVGSTEKGQAAAMKD